jgi:hypothetical protein
LLISLVFVPNVISVQMESFYFETML